MNQVKRKIICLLPVLAGIVVACNDTFDAHYKADESVVSDQSLMELIDAQPELKTFASLLRTVSYDTILAGDQSYTVWAPLNEALRDVDINDKEELLNMVENHIARYTHSVSGNKNENVYMLNGKLLPFNTGNHTLDGKPLDVTASNRIARNGLLHTLNERVPFRRNIWEYLLYPEFDSIRTYLYSFNEKRFIPELSPEIDVQDGLIVYDSVFSANNTLWNTWINGIGYLNDEDSIYTMLLPTNEAWAEAYSRIEPYYVSNHPQIADSLQRSNTQYALVQDLVFRGAYNDPTLWGENDSLVSTRSSVFYDPAYLFDNADPVEVSNGWVYPVNKLNHRAIESWNKPIPIEAEWSEGREVDAKTSLFSRFYAPDNTVISNYGFLEISSSTAALTNRVNVSFEISNVLSTAYDIYCVFLPNTFPYPQAVAKKTRVRAEIAQLDRQTGQWKTIRSGGGTGAAITPADNGETMPNTLYAMLISKGFKFPHASVGELQNTYRIKVTTFLSASDSMDEYENRMFIDYILLIPSL
jgi:uncharacterized surface protein with fasciclin (FAS1) repeats